MRDEVGFHSDVEWVYIQLMKDVVVAGDGARRALLRPARLVCWRSAEAGLVCKVVRCHILRSR